jgi:hypothetical protein
VLALSRADRATGGSTGGAGKSDNQSGVSLIVEPGSLRLGDKTCGGSNAAIRVPAPLLEHFYKCFFIILLTGYLPLHSSACLPSISMCQQQRHRFLACSGHATPINRLAT